MVGGLAAIIATEDTTDPSMGIFYGAFLGSFLDNMYLSLFGYR